jgi:hypothetical protein
MITFHPSASKLHNGLWRPMVMVRGKGGRMIGSRVAIEREFADKEDARNYARNAAHRVAIELTYTKVA